MKKLIIVILFASGAMAQQPDINWMLSAGGTGQESLKSLYRVAGDSLLAAGNFSGALNMGNVNVSSVPGGTDMFIVKFDEANNVAWVKIIGNACQENLAGVATDAAGNIYATGSFYNALSVDDTTVYATGSRDGFLVSLDVNGNLNWLKAFGGPGSDEGAGVAVDAGGFIYLAANMDLANFSVTDQPSSGGSAHIAKFEGNGNLIWSNCESGDAQSSIRVNDLVVDAFGSVYAAGSFFGQVLAGNGGSIALQSASENLWTGRYDVTGATQFLYTLSQSGNNMSNVTEIAATPSGNLVVSAYQTGNLVLNGNSYQSTDRDILVYELTPSGTMVWGSVIVSQGMQSPEAIAVDVNGNVAVGGLYIGDFMVGGSTLTNQGGTDGFLILMSQGTIENIMSFAGAGNDVVHSLVSCVNGFVSGGDFSGGVTTSMNAGGLTVNSAGEQDCFIARVIPATTSVAEPIIQNEQKQVLAYPNPASSFVTFNQPVESPSAWVDVYSVTGTKVNSTVASPGTGGHVSMDVTGLAPGTYLAGIRDGNKTYTSTFIVR